MPGSGSRADPWQLRGSVERLQRERVAIDQFNFSASSVQKLSTTLYGAICSSTLRVYPDDELEREILGLRVIESPSGWRFDHRTGGYSDRAVALAMAIELAQRRPQAGPAKVLNPNEIVRPMRRGDVLDRRLAAPIGNDLLGAGAHRKDR